MTCKLSKITIRDFSVNVKHKVSRITFLEKIKMIGINELEEAKSSG